MSERPHGSLSSYRKGCRCDECRRAKRDEHRKQHAKGVARIHGLSGYKNFGCRCEICSTAKREENRANEDRFREGIWEAGHGTRRRADQGCDCTECAFVAARTERQRATRQQQALSQATKRWDRWSDADLATLRKRLNAGVRMVDIAVELGRSLYAVRGKVAKLAAGERNA